MISLPNNHNHIKQEKESVQKSRESPGCRCRCLQHTCAYTYTIPSIERNAFQFQIVNSVTEQETLLHTYFSCILFLIYYNIHILLFTAITSISITNTRGKFGSRQHVNLSRIWSRLWLIKSERGFKSFYSYY